MHEVEHIALARFETHLLPSVANADGLNIQLAFKDEVSAQRRRQVQAVFPMARLMHEPIVDRLPVRPSLAHAARGSRVVRGQPPPGQLRILAIAPRGAINLL